jgi:hypothetical protein
MSCVKCSVVVSQRAGLPQECASCLRGKGFVYCGACAGRCVTSKVGGQTGRATPLKAMNGKASAP